MACYLVILYIALLLSLPIDTRCQRLPYPAVLPLALRSPYLSSWHTLQPGVPLAKTTSTFTSSSTSPGLGWDATLVVDGHYYPWLTDFENGGANNTVNLTQTLITPTRTVLNFIGGAMEFNFTFFSPIEPGDLVRQSIPFTYLYMDARSLDGAAHSVHMYTSIGGEWNSANWNDNITWATSFSESGIFHGVTLQHEVPFTESNKDHANWGTAYYATRQGAGVTYKTNSDANSQGQFGSFALDDKLDTRFRSIMGVSGNPDLTFPVFAFAKDFGNITTTQQSEVWILGYTRDPGLQYIDFSGNIQSRSLYFYSDTAMANASSLIDSLFADFPSAVERADRLDQQIMNASNAISSQYTDLVSLAARQAYAGTEVTIARGSDGSWNESDVMMFMKDLGGTIVNRVNAVQTLYAAFPVFMVIDPPLGALLLEPLLRYQNSPRYTNKYAALDIGLTYPNATAGSSPHVQGVEQSGNMIIMVYAHARASGDGNLINRYYGLLKTWADYLANNTLFLSGQSGSADDGSVEPATNETNLAIKGIIAIRAMAEMSSVLNKSTDASYYSEKASNLSAQWESLAIGSNNHIVATYGQDSSWTLCYNLFADRWLGTNVVDSSIYDAHTAFVKNLMSTSVNNTSFGIPTDSTNLALSTSAWNIFAAAVVTDPGVRDSIISGVHNAASYGLNTSISPFPLHYDSTDGSPKSGSGSPGQGAMFAPLALTIPALPIRVNDTSGRSSPNTSSAPPKSHSAHVGAIVGAVVGGIVAFSFFAFLVFLYHRRMSMWHRRLQSHNERASLMATPFPNEDDSYFGPGAPVSIRSGPTTASENADPSNGQASVSQVPESRSAKALARLRHMNAGRVNRPGGSEHTAEAPDTQELRAEIERLRSEMEQRMSERHEPPPMYVDERGVMP